MRTAIPLLAVATQVAIVVPPASGAVATVLAPMGSSAAAFTSAPAAIGATQVPVPTSVGPGPEVQAITIHVGGEAIRALCTAGRTEVVLLHGEGSSAASWRPVLERLEGEVGACAYDRRGSGRSAPAPERRGWYELLDELRGIHEALGARPPYLLVGHSLGGLYARLYAADRPTDVGGLVLVEPAHEDLPRRVRPGMPDEAFRVWMRIRAQPNADGIVEERLGDRARRARLPAIPVTVLTATRRRGDDGWDPRFLNEAARQVHASILHGASRGRHVPAEGSGHAVQRDDPALVTAEILRIVDVVRARTHPVRRR